VTEVSPERLLLQFCGDLRLLWQQAGGPSLRTLGQRVRLGKSQVGAILNGRIRELPDWRVVKALVDSFREYAKDQGRLSALSVTTGVEEYWRPRYAALEYALGQSKQRSPAERTPDHARRPTDTQPLRVTPRQLPSAAHHFAGRASELEALTSLAEQAADAAAPVVISAIDGTAGIGKTALAVQWAHRIADRFPDGQLYLNLRGFDPAGSPMPPAEAVRELLDVLDFEAAAIPVDLDAQIGLYRSLLSGRRMLILLDNARDADQVRPLLPGSPGCLVVITSRNRLTSLIAVEGAHPITLDLLSTTEARELLTRRLGATRVAAEPHEVDELITRCARLPLALSIVAARAAANPDFPLAALTDELREACGSLEAFDGADSTMNIREIFSWSYQRLSVAGSRLFRLLALHAGPDISTAAAASVAGVPPSEVRPALAELARAHLMTERIQGRFTFHDLLRAYATELADMHDSESDRWAAMRRALDYYLHSAYAANQLLNAHRDEPITLMPAEPDVTPKVLTDHGQALAWFTSERPVLLAAIGHAVGFDTHAWQLAWAVAPFLEYQGQWHECADTQTIALAAARRLGDESKQALSHRLLSRAYIGLGRYDDAYGELQEALNLYDEWGDHVGQAHTQRELALLFERQGRYREALPHGRRALDLFKMAGHRAGEGRALNAVGWFHAQLGDHRQSLIFCQQALDLQSECGDWIGEAETWDSLGYSYHCLGDHAKADACYQRAIDLYRELGDHYNMADTLISLGDMHHTAGHLDLANATWRYALVILDQLDLPEADKVRSRLERLGERGVVLTA
jgi:tetratricopeptide (TPR) repeat protein